MQRLLYLLLCIALTACNGPAPHKSTITHNASFYCAPELALISDTTLPELLLNPRFSPEQNRQFVLQHSGAGQQSSLYYSMPYNPYTKQFGHSSHSIPLTFYTETSSMRCFPAFSSVHVLINMHNKLFLDGQPCRQDQPLHLQVKDIIYNEQQWRGAEKFGFVLAADRRCSLDTFSACVGQLVQAHLLYCDSLSRQRFGMALCSLDSGSVQMLRNEFPFRLDITYRPVLPPPGPSASGQRPTLYSGSKDTGL